MTFAGDNMMGVKRTNRSAVLRALHQHGPLSRKRLAELLRLTPAAITKITAEMCAEGLLKEGNTVDSAAAGRREILLEICADHRCALGMLLNLRQAIVSAVTLDGAVCFCEEIPLPAAAPAEETTAMLAERLLALMRQHEISRERVALFGVAVRGILTADGRGVQDSFGALRERDYPLCDRLEALTGFDTVLENNVRALFAAQCFFSREGRGGPQFFLRCEYGIGAALSIDGQMLRGATQKCAEIGHIPVIRRGGKLCSCGKTGCLETIASPAAITEEALSILSEEKTPILWRQHLAQPDRPLDVEDVLSAAAGGDLGAAEIVDRAIIALGSALKGVVYLLDPEKIVLYGRMFDHPYFLSRLSGEMQEGVDGSHAAALEKSRYNRQLDRAAAPLLAVAAWMENGGM